MYRDRDDDFEGFLESNMANSAEQHIRALDRRMSGKFERPQERERTGFFGRTPALRLALSHAVIALAFFGVGFYLQSGGDVPFSLPQEVADSGEASTEFPIQSMNFESNSSKKQQTNFYSNAQQIDSEELSDLLGIDQDLASLPSARAFPDSPDSSATSTESSDGGASSASAAEMSAPMADMAEADQDLAADEMILSQMMNMATEHVIQDDGFLYALTANALLRLDLRQAEVLLGNLQAPAGWSFDEEGNILVVDSDGEKHLYYKLNRLDSTEESDSQ